MLEKEPELAVWKASTLLLSDPSLTQKSGSTESTNKQLPHLDTGSIISQGEQNSYDYFLIKGEVLCPNLSGYLTEQALFLLEVQVLFCKLESQET